MKFLGLVLLAVSSLLAQNSIVQNPVIGQVYTNLINMENIFIKGDGTVLIDTYLTFQITRAPNGDKTFTFEVFYCAHSLVWGFSKGLTSKTNCYVRQSSSYLGNGVVQAQIGLFLDSYGDVLHRIVYGPTPANSATGSLPAPRFTTAQPAPSGDPYLTMLDGLGNTLLKFDMTDFSILAQVVVPRTVGPYGVRPARMGPENEYWVADGGTLNEISISDLGTQTVLGTIPTSSLDPNNTVPVGITFTNDGGTALYAVSYYTPDSSGNNGTLLIFNAASRTLISTLPLKYAPTALVMAPDGLTAYLLSSTGMITYYDVLSGTADLSLSTYTPGRFGGYPGRGTSVFVHPDGTRLFWNNGAQLESFDLARHQVTAQFDSGLPATSGVSMTISQDGSMAFMSNGAGNEVFLDTRLGNIQVTYTAPAASLVFGGPPQP